MLKELLGISFMLTAFLFVAAKSLSVEENFSPAATVKPTIPWQQFQLKTHEIVQKGQKLKQWTMNVRRF